MKTRTLLLGFILCLLFHPIWDIMAHGTSTEHSPATPAEVVKNAIDQILEAVNKYPCKGKEDANCTAFKERVHEIAEAFIDFDRVSKLALGRYRRRFNETEIAEFKRLFQELLERTYMRKLQDYSGEKIIFERERKLNEFKVQVNTKVITSTNAIPVSYRLFKKNGHWKVYDILVEGVSLLKNYRQQFSNILRSKKPDYLIKLLQKKLSSLDENR